eukprot:1107494-Pelagomonas_calceolata.AAC.4
MFLQACEVGGGGMGLDVEKALVRLTEWHGPGGQGGVSEFIVLCSGKANLLMTSCWYPLKDHQFHYVINSAVCAVPSVYHGQGHPCNAGATAIADGGPPSSIQARGGSSQHACGKCWWGGGDAVLLCHCCCVTVSPLLCHCITVAVSLCIV